MSILQSVFLGTPGRYNIAGIDVEFSGEDDCRRFHPIIDRIIGNSGFRFLTQGNLHVLIHEMGHAFAYKLLHPRGQSPRITIYGASGSGCTLGTAPLMTPHHNTIFYSAGPILDMLFSSGKLALSVAMRSYISLPVATVIGVGALFYMVGELLLMTISIIHRDSGDFDRIAQTDTTHLMLATAALVSTFALGIFGAVKLW